MGILLLLLAMPLGAQSFEAWMSKAEKAEKRGAKTEAAQYWSNALFKWKPSDGKKARAKALAARAALQEDPDLALKDLSEALKNDPKSPKLAHRRGVLLLEKGDAESALSDFYAATKLDIGFGQAFFDRGRAYEALGDHAFAAEDFKAACELGVKAACGRKRYKPAAKAPAAPKRSQTADARPAPSDIERAEAPAEPEAPFEPRESALGTEIERSASGAPKRCVASIAKCAEADGGTYEACVPKGVDCPQTCVRKFRKALNTQSEAQAFREIFESGRACD